MQKQIPKNWQEVKLGDILIEDPQYGYTASSSKSKVGPKLLRITDIQGDFVNWDDVPYCEIPDSDKQKYILMEGDIVFARTGNTTGANYFIKKLSIDEAVFASYLIRIRPDPIKCLPGYLAYFLRSKNYWKQVNSLLSGSAQPGINATLLKEFTFDLPNDIKYQRDIVSILSAFDDKIEVNNKIAKTLEEMAQAIFKEWFVHFKFPGYEKAEFVDSELGRIPKGWAVKQLGEVADVEWGDTSITKASYVSVGYPAYSASGHDGFRKTYDFDRVGIVLSAIGANCGITWLASRQWSAIKNTIRFWSIDDRISTEYLFLSTRGQNTWPQRGSAQPFISLGDARKRTILKPTRNILTHFNDFIVKPYSIVDNLNLENQKLTALRDLLLPKLMKGEVRV